MSHTPTPWLYLNSPYVFDSERNCIAVVDTDNASEKRMEANAAFIVKAVNAHDELVAVLKGLLACPSIADVDSNDPEWGCGETANAQSKARAALAKVGAL